MAGPIDNKLLRELARDREWRQRARGSGGDAVGDAGARAATGGVIDLTGDDDEDDDGVVVLGQTPAAATRSAPYSLSAAQLAELNGRRRRGDDGEAGPSKRPRAAAAAPQAPADVSGFNTFRTAGAGGVTLRDVMVVPGVTWDEVVMTNYMIDSEWMATSSLGADSASFYRSVGKLLLITDGRASPPPDQLCAPFRRAGTERVEAFNPPRPIEYGVHHSKMIILASLRQGVRVVVTTANFIRKDIESMLQGVYVQDFPPKPSRGAGGADDAGEDQFGRALGKYFEEMGAGLQRLSVKPRELLDRFDFSRAAVRLIASVPGEHRSDMNIWGHMVRARRAPSAGGATLAQPL